MKHHLKYISYVYDSPLVTLYSYTLINSCNYVFLFDKATYLEFHNAGIPTVYYLPLAANVSRLSAMKCPDALLPQVSSDVSFVGSLYNEEHNLFERLNGLSDYTRGYLDSIMLAQQNVYGYFFWRICSRRLSSRIYRPPARTSRFQTARNPLHLYMPTTSCAGKLHPTSACHCCALPPTAFHSNCIHHPSPLLPKAEYIGPVDYYDTMPYIFQHSRINLNITLKSIHSGIPLRCMDIMGSGGFPADELSGRFSG